jgi:hypothetical protein
LRAAEVEPAPGAQLNFPIVTEVILPLLSAVEKECGEALSRIRLDDVVNRAAHNGGGASRRSDPA